MRGSFKVFAVFVFGILTGSILWKIFIDFVADKPVPNAVFSSSIIDLKEKILINNKNKNKIVIVGGSNAAFGVDSKAIENEFGIKSINFGCMAGIGPEILLSKIQNHISKGDIVLFCWEYGLYRFDRTETNFTYLNLVFGPYTKLRSKYSLIDNIKLSLTYPTSNIRTSIAIEFNPYVKADAFRCGWAFDDLGNVRSNNGKRVTNEELYSNPSTALMTELTIAEDAKEILTRHVNLLRNKDVTILATWPNIFHNPMYETNHILNENLLIITRFWNSLDVPMVGHAKDAMMNAEYIYDTYDHLNAKGVKLRTEKLIHNLKPLIF